MLPQSPRPLCAQWRMPARTGEIPVQGQDEFKGGMGMENGGSYGTGPG